MRGARGLVAAAAGLGLVATPLALTTGAVADDSTSTTATAQQAHERTWRAKLTLYALNDFHGQLEKLDGTKTSSGRIGDIHAGGAEYLSTHLDRLRAATRSRGGHPLTVAAGDLIGATPLLSAAFHDEPSIEAMNSIGLDISSVGNHEFDEGYRELLRMQSGGCIDDGPDGAANQNSCPDPAHPFEGADFDYLAANVKYEDTRETILPPYTIRKVDGEKVGFIGMTLQDTPNIVTKEGIEGLKFTDEVKTVNRLVPKLQKQGVEAVVVLLHEGGAPVDPLAINECSDVTGPGMDIARALDPEVDLVISGHTHQAYNCTVLDPDGRKRLITSASSLGRVVTEVRLKINRSSGEVIRKKVRAINHIVTNSDGTTADAAITELIARYKTLVAPIANEVLGKIEPAATQNALSRTVEANGRDSALGNLIADAQKADPSTIPDGGVKPVVALMNPGGIRADLVENTAGDVTYEAAFNVQPFNNYVVSMDLTGQQILDVLNEQWNVKNESTDVTKWKVLQVSGLKYTFDTSKAQEVGVNALETVLIDENGDGNVTETLDPLKTYRVVVNSFLSDGGDGFATLDAGTNKYFGGLDIDSLADYLGAHTPYTPTATDRISSVE